MSDHDLIRRTIARNNQALDVCGYDECVQTHALKGSIAGRRGHEAILEVISGRDLARPVKPSCS